MKRVILSIRQLAPDVVGRMKACAIKENENVLTFDADTECYKALVPRRVGQTDLSEQARLRLRGTGSSSTSAGLELASGSDQHKPKGCGCKRKERGLTGGSAE